MNLCDRCVPGLARRRGMVWRRAKCDGCRHLGMVTWQPDPVSVDGRGRPYAPEPKISDRTPTSRIAAELAGSIYYVRPRCINGHAPAIRRTSTSGCVLCERERGRRFHRQSYAAEARA